MAQQAEGLSAMNMSDGSVPTFPGGSAPTPTFAHIPGWHEDDLREALSCFASMASCIPTSGEAARGELSARPEQLACLARLAASMEKRASREVARDFFAEHFFPVHFDGSSGRGFVTAYFEPELPASRFPTGRFRFPLYARPADLVPVDVAARPPGLDRDLNFARRAGREWRPYFDRAEIDAGALAGRGLEIAYLDNPIDAFLVHVQGSAALKMEGGGILRVTHDGRNGFPYTSIGKWLIDHGEIRADDMSMIALRAWLEADDERAGRLMQLNRSYIFFRCLEAGHRNGPVGSAGVSLQAGRSLAVDSSLISQGTPVWIATDREIAGLGDRLARLTIAQDSGSAITGPGRGDIFWGSGAAAGAIAGNVRHDCRFIVLMPKSPVTCAP